MRTDLPASSLGGVTRREVITAMALTAFAKPVTTQGRKAAAHDDLAALLEPLRLKHGLPALGGGILTLEGLTALGATGYRKQGDPTRVGPGDRFHLGSCMKAITATLVGRLVEQGKLRWTTTVAEGLPFLPKEARDLYAAVTIEHLLAHRSGMPDGDTPPGKSLRDVHLLPGSVREQRAKYLQEMFLQKPAAKPGMRFAYSNAGYVALGAMAESAAGKPWETLVVEAICTPLGMRTVGFGAMGVKGKMDQPRQHEREGLKWVPVEPGPRSDNPPAFGPAGRMHCSLTDWALFLRDQLRGAAGKSGILKSETYRKLTTPSFGGTYAGGWGVTQRDWAGGKALSHAGSNTMNFTVAWLAPAKGFGVFVATNAGGTPLEGACDEVISRLIQRHLEGR